MLVKAAIFKSKEIISQLGNMGIRTGPMIGEGVFVSGRCKREVQNLKFAIFGSFRLNAMSEIFEGTFWVFIKMKDNGIWYTENGSWYSFG